MGAVQAYAELHAYSCFSFHRGASSPRQLIEAGACAGLYALAITDRDGLYGSMRQARATETLRAGSQAGQVPPPPRPVYGSEIALVDGSRLVALVQNVQGWRNLSSLLAESRMACAKGQAMLPIERVAERKEGLLFLSGGRFGPVDRALLGLDTLRAARAFRPQGPWGRPLGCWGLDAPSDGTVAEPPSPVEQAHREARRRLQGWSTQRDDPQARLRRARTTAAELQDLLGDRFILELHNHLLPEDQWLAALLRQLSRDLRIPRAATNWVHYARPKDRGLQDVLSCIRLHSKLEEAGTSLLPNGHFHLKGAAHMARLFEGDCESIGITVELAQECRFRIEELPYSFPIAPVPEGHNLDSHLDELAWEGARTRYAERLETEPRIRKQLQHELDVVGRMGLAGYFLIVWDIARECRRRGILAQGRGSAANSCLCYCLQITAVDPIALDLLFERFLSEARGGYPDIDLDINNHLREEILQYVYERYGRDHVAMVCNVITYHPRSAVRDVAKAFGLGLDQADRLAKSVSHHAHADELDALLTDEGLITEETEVLNQVVDATRRICGFPRHLGIHSGGMVLSGRPIAESCPTENASMEDRTVLQWDKDDIAHAGMVKIDLLGLGMLSVLQEARALLRREGKDFDMAHLRYDDPQVYDLICAADTVGVFQIESRAQMNTLPRLQPRCFHDLVVEVALIRPGPIQGDMVHPYLRRRKGIEPVTYAHPSLEPILKRTLGIPLFQEQAMKMSIATAGFSPTQADQLRKVMGFKRESGEREALMESMVHGMVSQGIDRQVALQIRNQLRGFAAYGFPESHAASFALIVYASAWLKRYEPAAFFAALLTCQPMGFYSPATLVGDARRHGIRILPLCINRSDWAWTCEGKEAIRTGLLQVKGLGENDGRAVEDERKASGPYASAEELFERTGLDRGRMQGLARAHALACFGLNRRQALWTVGGLRRRLPLEGPAQQQTLPGFEELSPLEGNLQDHATFGLSPREHPLQLLREELNARGIVPSEAIGPLGNGAPVYTAGLVICRQRPQTAHGTLFVTLEDEMGFTNLIVRKRIWEKQRRLLSRAQLLACWGRVQEEDGVVHVLAEEFEDLGRVRATQGARSRARPTWTGLPSRNFR